MVVVRYRMICLLLIDIYVRHGEHYPLLPLSSTLTFDISHFILSQFFFFYKAHWIYLYSIYCCHGHTVTCNFLLSIISHASQSAIPPSAKQTRIAEDGPIVRTQFMFLNNSNGKSHSHYQFTVWDQWYYFISAPMINHCVINPLSFLFLKFIKRFRFSTAQK